MREGIMIVAKVNDYTISDEDYNQELSWLQHELHIEEPSPFRL